MECPRTFFSPLNKDIETHLPPNLNQLMHFFNDLLASKYVQKVGFNH